MNFFEKLKNTSKPYVIAEIGANHNGDMELAHKLVQAAKRAGADCVKFQSWTKDTIFSKSVYEENYFLADDYRDRTDHTLESIVEAYQVSGDQLSALKATCDAEGIDFASTPFAAKELAHLVSLDAPFVKVASMDCNNIPFLKEIAQAGKPVILSTGLSRLSEVATAVETLENEGNREIVLLHCVSVYPPDDHEVNLRNMETLRTCFPEYPVGFSDHTLGTVIPIAAVALGAVVIEKHFTLDKNMPGWDHKVSATESELASIVEACNRIPKAMGSTRRSVSAAELKKIPSFRRSVVATVDIKKGERIERQHLDCKRPGTGLEPVWLERIEGRIAQRDIAADELLTSTDF